MRYITAKSCRVCAFCRASEFLGIDGGYINYFCKHPDGPRTNINGAHDSDIIHPDCPLPELKVIADCEGCPTYSRCRTIGASKIYRETSTHCLFEGMTVQLPQFPKGV